MLRRTVSYLHDAAASGMPIVGLEPSCTATLRSDTVELLGADDRTCTAAAAVTTLAEVLLGTPGWQPPDLSNTAAVVQPHCHHNAVLGFDADRRLLQRAGIVATIVNGCCGLAGNFGAERGHYDISVAVAENDLLPAFREHPEAIALADGFSCRTQLDQLAARRGIHLAELLTAD